MSSRVFTQSMQPPPSPPSLPKPTPQLHSTNPGGQMLWHWPLTQGSLPQVTAQPPQLLASVCSSTQMPPQLV
jgi:hypothetical protein